MASTRLWTAALACWSLAFAAPPNTVVWFDNMAAGLSYNTTGYVTNGGLFGGKYINAWYYYSFAQAIRTPADATEIQISQAAVPIANTASATTSISVTARLWNAVPATGGWTVGSSLGSAVSTCTLEPASNLCRLNFASPVVLA